MEKIIIPERKSVASMDVHAQYTFTPLCPDELPVPEGEQIVTELNAQARKAQYRIGSKEAHNPQAMWLATKENPVLSPVAGENVDVRWPRHSVVGTKGFELIAGLPKITDYDFFVWEGIELDMHPYGVCYHDFKEKLSTGVIEFLQLKQVTHVIVGGLATDYCVKTTVLQLLRAKFQVVVNLAACRGLTPSSTQQALQTMQQMGAKLAASAEVIVNRP